MSSEKFNVSVSQKTTVKISEGQTLVSKVVIGTPIRSIDQAAFNAQTLNRQPGGYYLDWNNFTNVPDKAILENIEELDSFSQFGGGLKLKGNIVVQGSILPDSDERYNLGSPQYKWGSLYVKGETIYVGNLAISDAGDGQLGIAQIILTDEGSQTVDSDGTPLTSDVVILAKGTDLAANLTLTNPSQFVDVYNANIFRTSKYIVQIEHDSSGKYQSSEILVTHNGQEVFLTEYGIIQCQDSSLGEFSASLVLGNNDSATLAILFSPVYPNTDFKAKRMSIQNA